MTDWLKAERSMLHTCIRDRSALAAAVGDLNGYPFAERATEWIWNYIRETYIAVREPPATSHIITAIEALPEKEQDPKKEELVAILRGARETNWKSGLHRLTTRARSLAAVDGMERTTEAFERGDFTAGLETLERTVKSKVIKTTLVAKPLFPKKFVRPRSRPRIPTGLQELDRLTGGSQRGDSNLILGATGVGKSALCVELCFSALKTGHRVLYLDTENGEPVVLARFYSRMTGIPYELLERGTLGVDTEARLNVWLNRNAGRMQENFRYVPVGFVNANINQVEAVIQETIDVGFRPDIVMFDSPDHLIIDAGRKDAARWENFADLSNQIKGVAERTDTSLWSTSQVSGENIENKIAGTGNAADSKQKVKNASIVVSINRAPLTKKERDKIKEEGVLLGGRNNARVLHLAKNRNGESGLTIPLQCDLGRMTIKAPPRKYETEED